MFKLVIQDDEGKTTVVPLIRDEITIGRKEGNTIRLTERNVSRRHARILRNNGEVQIEDLGSYNGIRVNNARIAERVALRVSDQVQIGDYKLYLKAEGVEQVDDARTMPIERVDANGGAPTDVLPAVAATPTQPVPIQPTPAMPTPAPAPQVQVQGNPNRTLVAISDRPIATPELIAAAIPQQQGYGKLVVLSSNFAGKEFELSRPQMIIGRTDENDLVINHRSISRNHAKVVREPDTQRYTISDLQSSNGVRVNGQDYGKVELRRGDVIDLGHVRLRFVEPGEDFVFSRDAVITDVPEAGGKKGLLVAIVLGLLVLGGVVVFFLMKNGKEEDKGVVTKQDAGTGGEIRVIDAPEVVAVADAQEAPPGPEAAVVNPTGDRKAIETRCQEAVVKKDWIAVGDCGRELTAAGGDGKAYTTKSKDEGEAEATLRGIQAALAEKPNPNVKEAERLNNKIQSSSVYYAEAQKALNTATNQIVVANKSTLNSLARQNKCDAWNTEAKRIETLYGKTVADDVRRESTKCVEKGQTVVVAPKPCDACGKGFECVNDKCVKKTTVTPPDPPKSICDDAAEVANILKKGDEFVQQGSFGAALGQFEKILKCNPGLRSKAYLSACRAKNFKAAKTHFDLLGKPDGLAQICMKEGYDPRNAGPPPGP